MTEFLTLQSLEDSLRIFMGAIPVSSVTPSVSRDSEHACGYVSAEDVFAGEDSPSFARSTVDGYAVRAKETFGASETLPAYLRVVGEVLMGTPSTLKIKDQDAVLIHTGGMVPLGADAVVMLEDSRLVGSEQLEVFKAVSVEENMIRQGEDVKIGELIIPDGRRLRPIEIGGLLSQGITTINVHRQPIVGIISSGDELVIPSETPAPGQVRDINSYTLAALVSRHHAEVRQFGLIPDNRRVLARVLNKAFSESDTVIVTAGSSISSRDMTAALINELGRPGVLVHGMNIKPGKPTILAVCEGKPVIGLPGNPISAFVIANLIVLPLLEKLSGNLSIGRKPSLSAVIKTNIPSQSGRLDIIPVILEERKDELVAEPIFFKSNLIFNLVKATGLIHIPENSTGLEAGEHVEVFPLQE
jgi:molybdopterin molybdotransferase